MTTLSEFRDGRNNSMKNYLDGTSELPKKVIKDYAAATKENYTKKANLNRTYWLGRLRGFGDVRKLYKREFTNES